MPCLDPLSLPDRPPRVLLVAFSFPPSNSMGAVRLGKLARHLEEQGWDYRVLTVRRGPRPGDPLPLEVPEERVVRAPWVDVSAPFSRAASGARRGRASSRGRGRLLGLLAHHARGLVQFPDSAVGWLPGALLAGRRLLRDWRPDLVLSSNPPPTAHLVGMLLAGRRPWVADLRDPWSQRYANPMPGWRRGVDRWLEGVVLRRARALVTTTEGQAAALRNRFRCPVHVVANGYDPRDHRDAPVSLRAEGPMVLLYTGTVYWGGHRVDRLFEALRLLEPGERARIRVRFHHGALEALREQGKDLDDCLELRPPLPYLDSLRAQREADALLYLPWDGPGGDDIAHGKLYEYLGARRPILAVGSPRNVWVRMLRDRGAAEAGERAEEVAGVLRRWLRERPLPPTPAEAAAGVERERQFRVLEEVLREAAWGQDRGLRAGP